jgi:hypothetical protein
VKPPPSAGSGAVPSGSASTVSLPSGTVFVNGKATPLRQLTRAVMALVPANCRCDTELKQLTAQASRARVSVYFVGTTSAMTEVNRLARTDGPGTAVAVEDVDNLLRTAYQPDGLTVILVRPDTSTVVHRHLRPNLRLEDELSTLRGGAGATAGAKSPAPSTT